MAARDHEVASLDDLAGADMRPVEVGGKPILLIRDGAAIRAVDAICPHAGAPLAQGLRRGHRLICPWHKAAFCIPTGAVLDPPAVDNLSRYTVRVDGQRVLVTTPAETTASPEPAKDDRCFVIIGAGAAGAVAAQTLRQEGVGGRVLMLDRENRVPYDRTILSKYALSGEPGAEKSPLQSQSFYQQHAIERLTAEVRHIDPAQRLITCGDGTSRRYDAALVATGGEPTRPDLPGISLGNVFLLRSRADADAILAQAERSRRAVILGASFIGMEVAASLRERGLDVTVVGKETVPFEKQLGGKIGGAFVTLHASKGVNLRLGQTIKAIEGERNVRGVMLGNGEILPADLVVAGFGVRPATGFLDQSLLHEDGGIPVDATLRVTDGLYAAGDVARFPLFGDGSPIRVEHWRVAQQHGRRAALNMLGRTDRYDAVPVFWTIQYLKRLDYIGHATEWDDVVVHGDLRKPEFIAYYVKDNVVRAAVGMDRDQDTAALIELMTLRRTWSPEELGDSPAAVLAAADF
jgi:NADPH-dependent 2,4-dienoyl-CoA reductase/sulfur reductase-like enzyme/nitrite reductase/ring-hydroxylating ferredoxin subunit